MRKFNYIYIILNFTSYLSYLSPELRIFIDGNG